MAGGEPYSADTNSDTFANEETLVPSSSEALESVWVPTSAARHGSKSMVNFEDVCGGGDTDAAPRPYLRQIDLKEEAIEEDYCDGSFQPPGKKRRLSADQVHFLERHFEVENKLEPERKIQLAKELGLQPRQVAIWFQNRRARYKTKQLEKEFNLLKARYESLKADHDKLIKEKESLKGEVLSLKDKLRSRAKGSEERSLQADDSLPKPTTPSTLEDVSNVDATIIKQEDASSAKSDVFDSDSLLEPANSSHGFEPADCSDFSQDEDDSFGKSLLPLEFLPRFEDGYTFHQNPPAISCNFAFPAEENPFWSWSY
ncbi:homeobox-leucine zipper protein HAT5 [Rhodamnia argentea]|uniref:Homeobox-leucine zipper protein n=1 Tax=Rhodamnia argentea TaxID=178133 RepID=A0A8B8MVM5_9MYRT|nr:homeobox-leucine zipper protein HAT5 [Rhodamnia argentea]